MQPDALWPGAHSAAGPSLFQPGRNCWRATRAERAAVLIDGDAYFAMFAAAALQAKRAIYILGWDFHSRMRLYSEEDRKSYPALLGEFLDYLVKRNRKLHVYILTWDFPMVYGLDREWPMYGLTWKPHRRVHLVYDSTHAAGGSHHQKVVVMDDTLAFCGGIDLTRRRWDTCAHSADDHRRAEDGIPYPPFHDVMLAVQGETARSLGEMARTRWVQATGKHLASVRPAGAIWPDALRIDLAATTVSISRTLAATTASPAVREVEQLYVDMIAAAQRSIYIENQYLTSHVVGDALAARLADPQGPEIVIVVRLLSHGWLEGAVMQTLRAHLMQRLRELDRYGKLHVFYPHVNNLAPGTCIDVHAKLAIVDDEWLRVGSANLANRSMGYDSECDLTVEARGNAGIAAAIHRVRTLLLSEHLDTEPETVARELKQTQSIATTVRNLNKATRCLRDLEAEPEISGALVGIAEAADLERPISIDGLVEVFSPDTTPEREPRGWRNLFIYSGTALALLALWKYTPLAKLADPDLITRWAKEFGHSGWAPVITLLLYTPACIVLFPRSIITLFATLAFGPVYGFLLAMTGVLVAAHATYMAGRRMSRAHVRRIAGSRLNKLMQVLRLRGLLAMTAIRLVPLAPFAVEGVIAGAIHIKRWHFLLGTALGMLPGTLTAVVFGNQLETALKDPSKAQWGWLALAVAVLFFLAFLVRRWLFPPHAKVNSTPRVLPRK
jgi:phosphatidylserine/phosphatidylglycerophosphate/cardiolipin synthase-like enzyme/uncharacterized membrane protein YdjX (TVP38/TMEM64 family)